MKLNEIMQLNELGYAGNIGVAEMSFIRNFGTDEIKSSFDALLKQQEKKEITGKEFWVKMQPLLDKLCKHIKNDDTGKYSDKLKARADQLFCRAKIDQSTV